MTAFRRWCAVALGVALFAAVAVVVTHRPAEASDITASRLLAQVRAGDDAPYSGLVATTGTLALPVTDQFTDVGDLLGGSTTLRTWWRSTTDWRVDELLPTGETDLVHTGYTTVQWSYERNRAIEATDPYIRLPRSSDLLPPVLTRRLLEGVRARDTSRLPAQRVAGHDALGLRIRPADRRSSVSHVDLWADRATGLPLRVEVYGAESGPAAFTTTFQEVTPGRPAARLTRFDPPLGVDELTAEALDIADAADRFSALLPPSGPLAGLAKSSRSQGSVGIYGRGLTEVMAVPLWDRVAEPLRSQLSTTPGVAVTAAGSALQVGPLSLLLTGSGDTEGWLLIGSVRPAVLEQAAVELRTHARVREHGGIR